MNILQIKIFFKNYFFSFYIKNKRGFFPKGNTVN